MHWKDSSRRYDRQQKYALRPCYMKGFQISTTITKTGSDSITGQQITEDYIMYSAMSHTKTEPLATKNSEDVLEMRHVSPFWAVMLAGRDQDDMVNMGAFLDEYKFNHPSGKTYGNLRSGSLVKVNLPFLTNTRLLAAGELLVSCWRLRVRC